MNERIKELAEAHLVRDEHTEFGWQECHKYVFDSEEIEEFVKSIQKNTIQNLRDMFEENSTNWLVLNALIETGFKNERI